MQPLTKRMYWQLERKQMLVKLGVLKKKFVKTDKRLNKSDKIKNENIRNGLNIYSVN
jgi:hypothetical protein